MVAIRVSCTGGDIDSANRAAPATSKMFAKLQLMPMVRLIPEPAGPCKCLRDAAAFAGMVFGSIANPIFSASCKASARLSS